MSVEFYIPHDKQGGPLGFDKFFEKEAIFTIARELIRKYGASNQRYAVVVNSEPYDLVILTPRGIGIADLKHCEADISGSETSPWIYTSGHPVLAGNNHTNPFQQIRAYKERIEGGLRSLPDQKLARLMIQARIQGGIIFTGSRINSEIDLQPTSRIWFRMHSIDEVPDWVEMLAFGNGLKIQTGDLDLIVQHVFNSQLWKEMDLHLGPRVWGALNLISNGALENTYYLSEESYIIGRDGSIPIPGNFKSISRSHALIRRTPHGIYVRHLSKTSNTYVNGKQLFIDNEISVKAGTRFIIGVETPRQMPSSSCELEFRFAAQDALDSTHLDKYEGD